MMAVLLLSIAIAQSASPSADRLVSAKGIGAIQLGMTLGEARNAVPAATFKRTSDGDGAALVEITVVPRVSMIAWAQEDDPEAPIGWTKRISTIETFSPGFRTAEGAHPGALVTDVNRIYGKTEAIAMIEIESREYIEFEKHPPGLMFRVDETRERIFSIAVSSLGQAGS